MSDGSTTRRRMGVGFDAAITGDAMEAVRVDWMVAFDDNRYSDCEWNGWVQLGGVAANPLLGPNLRFRILAAVLGDRRLLTAAGEDEFLGKKVTKKWEKVWDHHIRASPRPRKYADGSSATPYPVFRGKGQGEERAARLRRVLASVSGDLPDRTLEKFLNAPFPGETAPDDFLRWLVGMGLPTPEETRRAAMIGHGDAFVRMIRDRTRFELHSGKREDQNLSEREMALESILDHLASSELPQIWCEHATGMADGFTALALHIWEKRPKDDGRPWLYLPVGRGAVDVDVSYRSTVARLAAFYCGEDPASADPDAGGDTTDDRVAFIRRRMSEDAAVLIFDAYGEPSAEVDPEGTEGGARAEPSPNPNLSRLVRDEPLAPLLERLVHPHIDLFAGRGESDEFRRTRILVLGNSTVTPVAGHCRTSPSAFPRLPDDALPTVLAAYGVDTPDDPGASHSIQAEFLASGALPSDTRVLLMRAVRVLAVQARADPGAALAGAVPRDTSMRHHVAAATGEIGLVPGV